MIRAMYVGTVKNINIGNNTLNIVIPTTPKTSGTTPTSMVEPSANSKRRCDLYAGLSAPWTFCYSGGAGITITCVSESVGLTIGD